MGRPRKEESELRIHQVNIRLTENERVVATKQAEIAGLSIANWIRSSAFSKKALKIKVSPMHRAYYRQLLGASNNLNQIAKKINSGQFPKVYSELLELRKLLISINKLFNYK